MTTSIVRKTKGVGFVKGKRITGCFVIFNLNNDIKFTAVGIKKYHKRISARKTTLIENAAV